MVTRSYSFEIAWQAVCVIPSFLISRKLIASSLVLYKVIGTNNANRQSTSCGCTSNCSLDICGCAFVNCSVSAGSLLYLQSGTAGWIITFGLATSFVFPFSKSFWCNARIYYWTSIVINTTCTV